MRLKAAFRRTTSLGVRAGRLRAPAARRVRSTRSIARIKPLERLAAAGAAAARWPAACTSSASASTQRTRAACRRRSTDRSTATAATNTVAVTSSALIARTWLNSESLFTGSASDPEGEDANGVWTRYRQSRPRRYFSCEQVHKRFRTDAGGGLHRSIGPEIRGAVREEAPRTCRSVLVSRRCGRSWQRRPTSIDAILSEVMRIPDLAFRGISTMSPSGAGGHPADQQPDRRGRPGRRQRAQLGNGAVVRRRARDATSSRPATSRAPSTSRAATSSRASRAPCPTATPHVILYCASGNRSALAANTLTRAARLRERRVDDRRHHAVEGPRLRGRGPASLTAEQRERYSRHLLIPEIGVEGQQKLLDAKVLLLGAGGLGSPTALYLAAAGVGTLGIVDNDVVDLSNLQRQVIHTTDRIGVPEGRLGRADDRRDQPGRQRRQVPGRASTPRTSWRSSRATT